MDNSIRTEELELKKLIQVGVYLGISVGSLLLIIGSLTICQVLRQSRSPFALILLMFTIIQGLWLLFCQSVNQAQLNKNASVQLQNWVLALGNWVISAMPL
jgi:cytochrome c biogenesis protein CcdA